MFCAVAQTTSYSTTQNAKRHRQLVQYSGTVTIIIVSNIDNIVCGSHGVPVTDKTCKWYSAV